MTHLVTANATRAANTQGGAQSRRVTVRLYPSVAVRVGKNTLNESDVMIQVALHAIDKSNALRMRPMTYANAMYITLQSARALRKIRP